MKSVIHHPLVTEKAMDEMDFQNKLQFIVDIDANKHEIADAVSAQFDVGVESVRTQVTPQGKKKATVELVEDDDAQEVASRIGVF
ncbi:50S ribosomal protein L23 [Halobaculum limi]|jgi:large subunit ribosomal protein L23|uniref:50S ribosomal protein L23 n=1 Tax=Halobaculum limi TaxID=3031916 RepID=UPI002406A8FB|nr:50S ribosomal protein L23 [Halobaculum sp. YSMS11]